MPKPLITFVTAVDSFVLKMWKGLRWTSIAIIVILAYAVFVRHAMNAPSIQAYELAMFTMTAAFILAGAPLLLQDEHVRMDAFYARWSPRKQAIMDICTFVLFIYIAVMAFTAVTSTYDSFITGQHTKSIWGPPLWPLKACIAAGCIILLFQAIANLIRDIATIRGKHIPTPAEIAAKDHDRFGKADD
ncbi:MAG: TRAP transporter small permease subunit [Dehalococcoidales bacterium]|nr:TRAP transporter small permease subunit [Dehalococcoidales bacterium]